MLILTIRTDKPEAELGLYDGEDQLAYTSWQAHKQLAETIHLKIKQLLDAQKKSLQDIQAIIVFKGPGSFTGLRIGFTVANALVDSLGAAIVASNGEDWIERAIQQLEQGQNQKVALPEYGAPPHITQQKR